MPSAKDEEYMRRAIELARQGVGLASPGALVGAVIVKEDKVVGEGFYSWDGIDHAEVIALRQAGSAARGATVYTSLEPCSHTGRTPPCAQALIDAGVTRVVTAMEDPNPVVNGRGLGHAANRLESKYPAAFLKTRPGEPTKHLSHTKRGAAPSEF